MTRLSPIEHTTRFATTVDDLPAAWAFVMDRIDRVGPSPSVTISPYWVCSNDPDQDGAQGFEVVVSGMVEEEHPA